MEFLTALALELGRIAELRGRSCMIVSDNRTALTSNAVVAWYEQAGIEWLYIAPGNPMQNKPRRSPSRAAPSSEPDVRARWD